MSRLAPALACLWWCRAATTALSTEPSDLSCQATPSPLPGDTAVPLNALLFGFGMSTLTDPSGGAIATLPAPPPFDQDGRYHVPARPLDPQTTYSLTYELQITEGTGAFTTGNATDSRAPTAPNILWHAQASDANQFSTCATDRTELLGLALSSDDLTPQGDLRYSLSVLLPDGGLQLLVNELTPVTLDDGGAALSVQYGLEGLPGNAVIQTRDLAGNLSPPSDVQRLGIDPGCTFASSTTGRRSASLWPLMLVALLLPRKRRAPCRDD